MRRYFILAAIAACILAGTFALADTTSGTVTVGTASAYGQQVITWTWTSDASGNVVDNTATAFGELVRISFNPGDGATSPSANYDVDIEDQNGINILLGYGDNRSQSASQSLYFQGGLDWSTTPTLTQTVDTVNIFYPWRMPVYGVLTLKITNAGNAKSGVIRAYVKR